MFDLLEAPAPTAAPPADALSRAISAFEQSVDASAAARADAVCRGLRALDQLMGTILRLLGSGNGIAAATGLPAEMLLMLDGRRSHRDAATILNVAGHLRAMPYLAAAFERGIVSWSQLVTISYTIDRLDAEQRAHLDELIRDRAPALAHADADHLIALVESKAASWLQDVQARREQTAIRESFLRIQGRLDGSGSLYAEGDAETLATIAHAIDQAAERPEHSATAGKKRARQRYDALVHIAEQYLAGGTGKTRPQPRIYATIDLDSLTKGADSARLLARLYGGPIRISNVTAETFLCDASIIPIIFDKGRPIAVGNANNTFSPRVRNAIIARDGGCRFSGCKQPAGWTDAHHIIWGVGNTADDGILLCRRCHNSVHHGRWQITLKPDGRAIFRRQGRRHTSYPRGRPPQ